MSTSIKALEVSLYWQKHVLQHSKDNKQQSRCRVAISTLEAQLENSIFWERMTLLESIDAYEKILQQSKDPLQIEGAKTNIARIEALLEESPI